MPTDTIPIPAAPTAPAPDAPRSFGDKLLIDMADLAHLTSLSVRTLRRMDSARDIPGRVAIGRRVLFQTEIIREWVRAGLPGRDLWAALQKRSGKR
jgi:predicted DNA-binding transcriptional regulator AlpA